MPDIPLDPGSTHLHHGDDDDPGLPYKFSTPTPGVGDVPTKGRMGYFTIMLCRIDINS